MNVKSVIEELSEKHPGKKIIKNDDINPTEIICEIEPTSDHPEYSVAISIIDQSMPHFHKHANETYTILHGKLNLLVDGQEHLLSQGDSFVIQPHKIHSAKGDATVVSCLSKPGWIVEDHIIVDK